MAEVLLESKTKDYRNCGNLSVNSYLLNRT